MSECCKGIDFNTVVDLVPSECTVIVRTGPDAFDLEKVILTQSDFALFKFEAIRWVRKRPDPQDRLFHFETIGEHGVWSFDKEQRLIESRKTRNEKDKERAEDEAIYKLLKERGIR